MSLPSLHSRPIPYHFAPARGDLHSRGNGALLMESSTLAGVYGSKSLYRNLGYFSLICLLRVHVLLGDPTCELSGPCVQLDQAHKMGTVALQTMEHVELGGGAFMTRITACHVTTYYHVS